MIHTDNEKIFIFLFYLFNLKIKTTFLLMNLFEIFKINSYLNTQFLIAYVFLIRIMIPFIKIDKSFPLIINLHHIWL
jgi:hypothetical protein